MRARVVPKTKSTPKFTAVATTKRNALAKPMKRLNAGPSRVPTISVHLLSFVTGTGGQFRDRPSSLGMPKI